MHDFSKHYLSSENAVHVFITSFIIRLFLLPAGRTAAKAMLFWLHLPCLPERQLSAAAAGREQSRTAAVREGLLRAAAATAAVALLRAS